MRSLGVAALLALAGVLAACASMDASSAFRGGDNEPGAGSAADAGGFANGDSTAGSPELAPTDNGVILVHAAGAPAYRVCFQNEIKRKPQPDAQLMPEANVVGVEVGSAVRIAPLKGPPGIVWIFEEPLIRESPNATCEALVGGSAVKYAHKLPAIDTDLSKGVHLLALTGCIARTDLRPYTNAECGADYDETKGNLRLVEQELKGANRTGDALPTQVIHLSQPLESARGAGTLSVSFGDVKTTSSTHTSTASAPTLFGAPLDLTSSPAFDGSNEGVYADVGFRVSIEEGANPPTVVAQQSLADVQRLSAPRELPTTYYAAASNYVLLLLGDPNAKGEDGGVSDDPLQKVHLLAVPVIEPKADAGADAEAPIDGGSAPDGGT
jgi:hypothetical protein